MSTLPGSVAATFCATLVDEWARAGARFAVICPGSRSTPMALALAADERIDVAVRLDERSAAFLALGIGRASGVPAILLTTSGTAAAEAHAAVVEAHQGCVPMLVCTADRPPELHSVGAPQTISQRGLYAGAVRLELDAGVPSEVGRRWWRSFASRAVAETTTSPNGPGPVHVNLPFAEPLDGAPGELPPGRPDAAPWHRVVASAPAHSHDEGLDRILGSAQRPLVVAGGRAPVALAEAFLAAGVPVLADPRSGLRRARGQVIAAADALLRDGDFADEHEPDLVLRLGEAWASKVVNSWLDATAGRGVPHVLVDPYGEWRDPGRAVGIVVRGLGGPAPAEPEAGWAASWHSAEQRAQETLDTVLADRSAAGELTEPFVARQLASTAGLGTVVAASSMPVRDLEWFSRPSESYPTVFSNRGANGIDGVVSTTIGVARALGARSGAVVGLVGDLAFLHDVSALVRPAGTTDPCGLVVVDNRGGGIFSYLPQAASVPADRFEALFGTPQQADPAELARAAGCAVTVVERPDDLAPALEALVTAIGRGEQPVVVCRTDRARGVAVHDELNAAVAAALRR